MDMFKDLGFDKIYFCIAQDMDLLKVKGDTSIEPDEMALKDFYEKHFDMLYDKDVQLLDDMIHKRYRTCDSTQSVHTIYSNGNVVRCQSILSKNVIGNIHEELFSNILEKDRKVYVEDVKKNDTHCPFEETCRLVCQRRYDYEDRV